MKDIKAASVQFNHRPGDKGANLAIIKRFVARAAEEGVELIAFPEMCITGYWHVRNLSRIAIETLSEPVPGGPSTGELLALSREYGMTIGAGLVERADDGKLYNSYVAAMPDGRFACHRKLHCFISEHMASGDEFTVFDTPRGCRVGILICWDNNLVENARITALKGAEILLAPHQTGGCDSRSPGAMGLIDPALWQNRESDPAAVEAEFKGPKGRGWLMRWLPARAHDNGLFLLFSNGVGRDDNEVRTGNAMILGPYGEILAETWRARDEMVIATLKAERLEMCTGRRWIRGRRPELYGPLIERRGANWIPERPGFPGIRQGIPEGTAMEENYRGYHITALPILTSRGRWAVSAKIEGRYGGKVAAKRFFADDGISYILEVEAAKEGINLGKNLIKNNPAGF